MRGGECGFKERKQASMWREKYLLFKGRVLQASISSKVTLASLAMLAWE